MAMEQERISELLNKYFEGKTSEEEEHLLKVLLKSRDLPDTLEKEYGYLATPPEVIPGPSEVFEARLEGVTHINALVSSPKRVGRYLLTGLSAAAAVAAAIWIISVMPGVKQGRDTFSDPAIAMAEVRNILLSVSEKMNAGTIHLSQVGEFTNRPDELKGLTTINELLGKNLSRLRYLGDLEPGDIENETD